MSSNDVEGKGHDLPSWQEVETEMLRTRLAEADVRLAQQENKLRNLREQNAQLERQIRVLHASRSWYITAPLRSLVTAGSKMLSFVRRGGQERAAALPPAAMPAEGASMPLSQPIPNPDQEMRIVRVEQSRWDGSLPLVSVVIPCYNYGQYVEEAVESALNQTLFSVEVIVVDDDSTDPLTLDVLSRLNRPRTTLLRQANAGVSEARNHGIRQARGKYICCLDADDTLEQTYLEKCVSMMEANAGIGFVYSWVRLFGDEQGIWKTLPFDLQMLLSYDHVCTAAVFRRAAWELAGGYDVSMREGYEDWEFWIKLGEYGLRGHLIPEPLFNHRRHGITLTHTSRAKHERLLAIIHARHERLFSDPAMTRMLKAGYYDGCTNDPFLNLAQPGVFAPSAAQRHILLIVPWLIPGGAETLLHDVISTLRDEGCEFYLLTTLPSLNTWHDYFGELTPFIYHLPVLFAGEDREPFLMNLLRARAVQKVIVSSSQWGYDMIPEIKRHATGVEIINLIHSDADTAYFQHSIRLDDCIDRHIAVNARISERMTTVYNIARHKIRIIANGIDALGCYDPSRYAANAAIDLIGAPDGRRVVTWIGRLSQEKQPGVFLEIAARFKQNGVLFVLVGDGALADAVKADISRLGLGSCLRWIHYLPPGDVARVLSASDVLLMTSTIEGGPRVVLEALAMNVAVVAYDLGLVASVVKDGVNGFVIRPGDEEDMARRLGQLLDDRELLARCKANARAAVLDRGFTTQRMMEQYREVLCDEHAATRG